MQRPAGAQISHGLKARGVDVIFGIPGVHNVEMYRGIEEAGLMHVLARHEQGVGFMADGYARATGRPGVGYVITGPGLLNTTTALGQAYSDSVPVLMLSSCLERADLNAERGRLHDMRNQEAAGEAVCAWSRTALSAQTAYDLIDRALVEFQVGRPRPVHIQVPIDVAASPADPMPGPPARPFRAAPDPQAIARAAALLDGAKRPATILGGGAVGARDEVRALVDTLGALCLPTYAGKGVVHDHAPLSLGASLARAGSATWLARADLLLVLGSELSETDLWRDHPGHRCPMIRVDVDPSVLADRFRADLPILSDIAAFCTALGTQLGPRPAAEPAWDAREIAQARLRFAAEVNAERPHVVPWSQALMAGLPSEAMVVSDMTQFAYGAKEVVALDTPGRWAHPYGFGTLGYALPAAIGAKIGRGDAPVIAIAGDYGFQYTCAELGVAVELGLTLPILIWDNDGLGEIADAMVRAQVPPRAVTAQNPDFAAF
ncbi:MAG: thiamine pyrophosphate-binding protein, partial [Pseudomonadota bacterium]